MAMSITDPDDSFYLNGQISAYKVVLRRLLQREAVCPGQLEIAKSAVQEFASNVLYSDQAPEEWIIGVDHAEQDILKMIHELTGEP